MIAIKGLIPVRSTGLGGRAGGCSSSSTGEGSSEVWMLPPEGDG